MVCSHKRYRSALKTLWVATAQMSKLKATEAEWSAHTKIQKCFENPMGRHRTNEQAEGNKSRMVCSHKGYRSALKTLWVTTAQMSKLKAINAEWSAHTKKYRSALKTLWVDTAQIREACIAGLYGNSCKVVPSLNEVFRAESKSQCRQAYRDFQWWRKAKSCFGELSEE